jgi:hypothetical protein
MIYAGNAASALGSLLRKAQEDRQQGPHLIPQSAQEESPIRQQIQGPISAPESVGSEKVVSMKGEMQPIQEGGAFAPGVGGLDNPSVVPPIVAPMADSMAPGGASPMSSSPMGIPSAMSSGIGSSLLPSSMKPGAVSQGNVLGTSSPNYSKAPNFSPAGSRTISRLQADPSEMISVSGKTGKDSIYTTPQKWEKAQTPLQNVLGGIGKVGTNITSSLGLPQLMSGGIFKKLQDVMAPTIKTLRANSNKGRA